MKSSALTELRMASLSCHFVARDENIIGSCNAQRIEDAIKCIEKAIELIQEEENEI